MFGQSSCSTDFQQSANFVYPVSLRNSFKVKLDEIYNSYVFLNGQPYQTYTDKEGFGTYTSQLNFATHCATTACAISLKYLIAADTMIRNICYFHVVFQIWEILNTLGLRLPYVDEFNPFQSKYDIEKYRKLCDDFDMNPLTDWQYKYNERKVHSRRKGKALRHCKFCDEMDSRP